MKIFKLSILFPLLLVACSKENRGLQIQSSEISNASADLDTAKVPLNDLGTNTFMGNVGGLYPGGANMPSGTYATDLLRACKNILPIDSFGNSYKHGRVIFISLGGSTCGHNMIQLKNKQLIIQTLIPN